MDILSTIFTALNFVAIYIWNLSRKTSASYNDTIDQIKLQFDFNLTEYTNVLMSQNIDDNYLSRIKDGIRKYYFTSTNDLIVTKKIEKFCDKAIFFAIFCLIGALLTFISCYLWELNSSNNNTLRSWIEVIVPSITLFIEMILLTYLFYFDKKLNTIKSKYYHREY